MARRVSLLASVVLVAGTLVSAWAAPAGSNPAAPLIPAPATMAATGDSFSAGFATGSGSCVGSCPEYSWSTGTAVNSHYQRLLALNPALAGNATNAAVPGSSMSALVTQMGNIGGSQPDYVTVLLGGGDLCFGVTSPEDFAAQFRAGTDALFAASPDSRVLVASIWNFESMRTAVLAGNPSANWSLCDSYFEASAVDRALSMDRVVAYNGVLEAECATYANCLFDGNALFDHEWAPGEVSTLDNIHPSAAGQEMLAELLFNAGYNWDAPVGGGVIERTVNLPPGWSGSASLLACASPGTVVQVSFFFNFCSDNGPLLAASGTPGTPVSLAVAADVDYDVVVTASATKFPLPLQLVAASLHESVPVVEGVTDSATIDFAVVRGTVTDSGGLPFPLDASSGTPQAVVSVQACEGAQLPGPACTVSSVRRDPDASGDYWLLLPDGSWTVAPIMGTALGSGESVPVTSAVEQLDVDFSVADADYSVVSGTVTGGAPDAVHGVAACIDPQAPPSCLTLRYTNSPIGGGAYTLYLGPEEWNLLGFAQSGFTFAASPSQQLDLTDGHDPSGVDFVVPPPPVPATVTGQVTDPNGDPVTGTAVVGACPGTGPLTASCATIDFIDPGTTAYSLTLAEGTWTVLGVRYSPGTPVVADGYDEAAPPVTLELDGGDAVTCTFVLVSNFSSSCSGPGGTSGGADPGGTVTTDAVGTGATLDQPVQAGVTTPTGGDVTIEVAPTTEPAPAGFALLGQQVTITAPPASAEDPLRLVFRLDASLVPAGENESTIAVFRNGSIVGACDDQSGQAAPDPCVASRALVGDDVEIAVLTTAASVWTFGVANVQFDFDGFFAPISPEADVLNVVKAGQAVPVKFSLGGDFGLDVLEPGSPTSRVIDCDSFDEEESVEATVSASASGLTYDAATATYQYIWKTKKDWSGSCRRLVLTLSDGSTHLADFRLR